MNPRTPSCVLAAVLVATTAGCLDIGDHEEFWITYLGEDVKKPAVNLDDVALRDQFPDVVAAAEEAKAKGPGGSAWRNTSLQGFDDLFIQEAREQWNGSDAYEGKTAIYRRFDVRWNWTGSTFTYWGGGGP